MKKMIVLFFVSLFSAFQILSAQEEKAANKLVFCEVGGSGVISSLNYQMRFNPADRLGFGFRAGVGFGIYEFMTNQYQAETTDYEGVPYYYYNNMYETRAFYSFPIHINYIFGKKNSRHTFEVGVGTSILTHKVSLYNYSGRAKEGHFIGHISFMYRLLPINNGFSLNVGITPIIGTGGDLFPIPTLGFGYAF